MSFVSENLRPAFWRKVGLDAARTFIALFVVGLAAGLGDVADAVAGGNYSDAGAVGVAAVVAAAGAALSGVFRGVQALLTTWETDPELLAAREADTPVGF